MSVPINPAPRRAPWPEGLVIRSCEPSDAAGIAALHNLPGYRYGTLRTPYHSTDEIRNSLENPPANRISLVACLEGKLVGNAGLTRFANRRAHCASVGMGVHDDYTGRGIGRTLLGEIIATADNWLNLRRLELTVNTDNEAALALYRSFGFDIEGTLSDYAFRDGAYIDAYCMGRIRR